PPPPPATGLRIDFARRLAAEFPAAARRAVNVLLQMAALRNPGSVNANQITGERVSVLDVFNLLREYPRFTPSPSRIRAALRPIIGGAPAQRAKTRRRVRALIERFARAHADLISACRRLAPAHYGTVAEFDRSIVFHADFENRPLDALYRRNILTEFREAVDAYKRTNDPSIIASILDERIATSRRRADEYGCSAIP
ncbi:MAG TPA: hypothetical protein VHL59_02050, partial [Thermoanaerobaculia bacterium]|nr:hypothetical protein [Thermoanaerobaculia bacterium]